MIAENSCLASRHELDLFENPPTSASVQEGLFIEHNPVSALDDTSPIKFKVSGDSKYYLDLNASYFYLEVKITKQDGTDIDAGEAVGPVNLLAHSLFQKADIMLNDVLVSNSSNLYHYRAYLETLLSYNNDAKTSQLSCALYSKDKAGKMDNIANDNTGLVKRRTYTDASKTVPLIFRLHADVFLQNRYLLNGVDLKVNLTRNSNSLVLMAAANSAYKLKIQQASFFVRKVLVNKGLMLKHISLLEKQLKPAIYPIRKVEMKSYNIATGSLSWKEESLFSGILPRRIVIGLIGAAAFAGAYEKNPFNFEHHNLKFCSLLVDGKMNPLTPITCDFTNGKYLRNYFSLYKATGKMFTDSGMDIDRTEYSSGYAMLAWNFTPELEDSGCYHVVKKGDIRLELQFSQALTAPVSIVVYSEFDSAIKIDKDKNILPPY